MTTTTTTTRKVAVETLAELAHFHYMPADFRVNDWGGFDLIAVDRIVRLAADDLTWYVHLFTRNEVEQGRVTFDGALVQPKLIARTISTLLQAA